MLASSIVWILVVSGIVTGAAGLAGCVAPRSLLRLAFGVDDVQNATLFFARHWGVLIFVIGAMTVFSAYAPATRTPILAGAALEKIAVVALIFFGPLKRTPAMTVIAASDGIFAILYLAYLAGL